MVFSDSSFSWRFSKLKLNMFVPFLDWSGSSRHERTSEAEMTAEHRTREANLNVMCWFPSPYHRIAPHRKHIILQ